MAETVDTRVVEARFDSKQFEQGVDKTVKKLDELKKSLNLKDGEKTIAQIGDKISETSEKASDSLEKLEKRFTSFFGMLKNKMVGAIADEIVGGIMRIKNGIEGLVSSLSTGQIGYGMQRYTDMLTSVRTLVSSGVNQDAAYTTIERLGEYADQTSYSLDQLVSTMSKFKTAGASLDTAQRMVEGLSNAAASMGVNAQEASRAYLNLQQAYSKGKMTQADWISFESLPMVGEKFNQAILDAAEKVGTIKKNAKGTYDIVAKAIKEGGGTGGRVSGAAAKGITAENMGSKLASGWFNKKVMEEVFGGTYYFAEVGIDEVNEIKAKERKIKEDIKADIEKGLVAEENFDKEVTDRLQNYFDETNKDKLETKKKEIAQRKEAAKLDLEAKKNDQKAYTEAKKEYEKQIKELDKELDEFEKNNHLSAFAYQAFRAGQEARSFTDVMNTLKDTISRGWATSFELIFGKLDEAADFFTKLTESQFAEGIYKIGEFRNLVLENWRNAGGRDSLLGLLQQIDDIAGSIWKKLGLIGGEDVFDEDEYNRLLEQDPTGYAAKQYKDWAVNQNPFEKAAKELGQRIMILTRNIGDFFEKIKNWFTEADSTGTSRLDRISNILQGFGTIFTGVLHGAGIALENFGETYKTLKTVFDTLWATLEKVLQPIFDIFNPDKQNKNGISIYKTLSTTLGNLNKVISHLVEPLNTIITLLGDIFNNVIWNNIEKVIKPLLDMLDPNVDTNSVNIYQTFADALDNLNTVIQKIVGPLSTIFDVIANVLGEVLPFIASMGASTVIANIQFFTDAFALLLEVLGIGSAQQKRNEGVLDGIKQSIVDLGDACKSAFKFVSDFFTNLFADLRKLLGIGDEVNAGDGNIFSNIETFFQTNEFVQKVRDWIDTAIKDVGDFIKDIPNRIADFGVTVGDFFKGLLYNKQKVVDFDEKGNRTETEIWVRKPLTKWLEQAGKDVWSFITVDIPNFIIGIPNIVTEFINRLLYEKKTVAPTKGSTREREYLVSTPLKKWLDQAVLDVTNFITVEIPKFVQSIPNIIGKFFEYLFGKEKVVHEYKDGKLQSKKTKGILRGWLDNAIVTVKGFIKELPSKIAKIPSIIGEFLKSLFYDKKIVSDYGVAGLNSREEWVKKPFTEWIDKNIIAPLREFVSNLPDYIGQGIGTVANFAGKVVSAIFGKEDGSEVVADDVTEGIRKPFLGMNVTGVINSIKGVAKRILNGVISAFTGETDWDSNKNMLAEGVANFIEKIKEKGGEAWEKVKGFIVSIPELIGKLFTNDNANATEGDESTIGSAVLSFAGKVGEWISQIPSTLLTAWENAEKTIGILWNKIVEWVTGNSAPELKGNYANRFANFLNSNKTATQEEIDEFKESLLDEQWREDNPILANLKDFFDRLVNHIGEKIKEVPGLIRTAWEGTVDIFSAIKDVIFGTVNEEKKKEDVLYDKVTDIFTKVKDWVVTEGTKLGEKIRLGWNKAITIGSIIGEVLFGGKQVFDKKEYESILNSKDLNVATRNIEAELYKNSTKNFGDDTYNAIGLFFENVRDWIRERIDDLPAAITRGWEAFKDFGAKVGPTIVSGLQKGLDWIKGGIGIISTGLDASSENGEKKSILDNIDEYFDQPDKQQYKPLWENIKSFGENLMEFMVKTIPEFIGKAVKKIAEEVPKLLSGLLGGENGSLFGEGSLLGGLFGGNKNKTEKEVKEAVENDSEAVIDILKRELNTGYAVPVENIMKNFNKNFNKENPWEPYYEDASQTYEEWAASEGLHYNPNKKPGLFGALADEAEEYNTDEAKELKKLLEEFDKEAANMAAYEDGLKKAKEKRSKATYMSNKYNDADKEVKDYEAKINHVKDLEKKRNDLFNTYNRNLAIARLRTTTGAYSEDSETYKQAIVDIDRYTKLLEIIDSAETEISHSTTDEKKTVNFTETAVGFVGGLSDIMSALGDVASSDVGKTIITVLAVTYLLNTLADMLKFSDDIEEIGNAIKGVVLSAVFAGLTAILGYVIYLASMDPGSEKFKAVERIFGYLTEIAKWLGIFAIAWKGGGALKELFSNIGKGKLKEVAGASIADSTGLTSVIEMFGNLQKDITKPLVISGVGEAVVGVIERIGASLSEIGASIGQAIDTVMEYIAPAIDKISEVKDKLSIAIETVPELMRFIETFLSTFMQEQARLGATNRVVQDLGLELPKNKTGELSEYIAFTKDNFEDNLNLIHSVSTILTDMSNGMKAFDFGGVYGAKMKIRELTRIFNSGDFENMFGTLFDALRNVFVSKIGVGDNQRVAEEMELIAPVIKMIADSLSIFGTSINNISPESISGIDTLFYLIEQITDDISKHVDKTISDGKVWTDLLLGDTSLSGLARQIDLFATYMVSVFRSINNIRKIIDVNSDGLIGQNDEYDAFSKSIDLINNFSDKMLKLQLGNIDQHLTEGKAKSVQENLPVLAEGIAQAMLAMNDLDGFQDINFDAITGALTQMDSIAHLGMYTENTIGRMPENIAAIVDEIVGKDNNSGLIGRLKSAGTGWGRDAFGGISEFIDMLGQFGDAVQIFYEKTDSGKYKYEEGLGNIAQEMLNIIGPDNENPDWNMPKITPILEITEFEKEAKRMWNMLGYDLQDGKLVQANLSVDTSGIIFPEPKDYSGDLAKIIEKLTTIDTSTSTFSTDLKNVQFNIDGARLVGKIGPIMDHWLGQEGVFVVRTSYTT